ncbi:MAG TPA: hypothetical protein DD459_03410, partial [Halieaceae bacterium]|nr:hypothetical protein [Halieaceae bacterium]
MQRHELSESHSSGWLFCRPVCFLLAGILLLAACSQPDSGVALSGATMGTTWHVTYLPGPQTAPPEQVQA